MDCGAPRHGRPSYDGPAHHDCLQMTEALARILVADDEADLRALLQRYLTDQGYAVRTVDGGGPLDKLLARERFDVLVLDVMMPGEDGLAVAERIRDDPDLAGTRVIFLTARADIGDSDRARGTGAVGHVTKPFNPSSLGDEVRAALAR